MMLHQLWKAEKVKMLIPNLPQNGLTYRAEIWTDYAAPDRLGSDAGVIDDTRQDLLPYH